MPLKVFIVEPNDDVRDVFTLVLETLGYRVSAAKNYNEVAEQAAIFEPEVIFVAVGFDDADSIASCRQLRQHFSSGNTKIVALLGYSTSDTVSRLYAAGVDLSLQKPIEFERLLEVLNPIELAHSLGRS